MGPVRKPHCWFSHEAAQILTDFTKTIAKYVRHIRILVCLKDTSVACCAAGNVSVIVPALMVFVCCYTLLFILQFDRRGRFRFSLPLDGHILSSIALPNHFGFDPHRRHRVVSLSKTH